MARFLLALALAVCLFAAAPMTTLTIDVRSPGGKPVDNAAVIVKFVQGHSVTKLGKGIRKEWELRTNQEGLAKIPPIPQGKILVQVHAKEYQTFGQTFDVDEEQKTLTIKLNAPQPQYTAH
ncbi:MAG: carboxypeptidase-like regulatory domain-containing protein [Bryobacteraceae bacterium]